MDHNNVNDYWENRRPVRGARAKPRSLTRKDLRCTTGVCPRRRVEGPRGLLLGAGLPALFAHQIAQELADQAEKNSTPITREDLERMTNEATLQRASEEDLAGVTARLAAGGWPLSDPPTD